MPSQQAIDAARRRESTVDALMEEALVGGPPQQAAPPPPNYQNPTAVQEAFAAIFPPGDPADAATAATAASLCNRPGVNCADYCFDPLAESRMEYPVINFHWVNMEAIGKCILFVVFYSML
jgi:hypothetical protein